MTRSQATSLEARKTARLLYTGAAGFLVSAEATHERSLTSPTEPEYWPAICVNLCFAFELSLKAFLASRGATRTTLRKEFGHDLVAAFEAATSAGYRPEDPEIAELIEIFSPLHVSHDLRYVADKAVDLPETRNAIAIVKRLWLDVGAQIPIDALSH